MLEILHKKFFFLILQIQSLYATILIVAGDYRLQSAFFSCVEWKEFVWSVAFFAHLQSKIMANQGEEPYSRRR